MVTSWVSCMSIIVPDNVESMKSHDESVPYQCRDMRGNESCRKHLGTMTCVIVSTPNTMHYHKIKSNNVLQISCLGGNESKIPSQLSSTINNPCSDIIFSHENRFNIGNSKINHLDTDPFNDLSSISSSIEFQFSSVVHISRLFL